MSPPSPDAPDASNAADPRIDGDQLERHLAPLHAYVRKRMGQRLAARESCDDIVQSVCRELISAEGRLDFPTEEALHAWLQTAAMRKILQKARHYRSQRRDAAREVADANASQLMASGNSATPSREASAREQVARFEAALARLSADDREVITMIKVAGLSHEEAAQRTGRTVVASRTLLRRALIRLSALLTEDDV